MYPILYFRIILTCFFVFSVVLDLTNQIGNGKLNVQTIAQQTWFAYFIPKIIGGFLCQTML